tara:strand:- start:63837 stop:64544 length:708 start_codon:yes stop_codon:yes gene_type:complete
MRILLVLCLAMVLSLSCEKETDLISEYITISVNMSKLQSSVSGFPDSTSGKGCVFPDVIVPKDLTYYYLTFESIDTGDIQVIELPDLNGTFEMKHYGNNYNLTVTTHNNIIIPELSDQFHWYSKQVVNLNDSPAITVVLKNPYSAIVLINNDNSILGVPQFNEQDMYANINGWYIYSSVTGEELLRITKADGGEVKYIESFEPYTIYTYMYCDPMSLSISREDKPFILNKQTIFN